jgi:hypothetical protein
MGPGRRVEVRNAPAGNPSTRMQQLYRLISAHTSTKFRRNILTAVVMKSTAFSEVPLCRPVEIYRHFGGTCCLRSGRESWARKQPVECCLLSHYTHHNTEDCTVSGCYRLVDRETGVRYPDVAIYYTRLHSFQVGSGVHIIACPISTGGFSPGIKLSGRQAEISPRNSAEVKHS